MQVKFTVPLWALVLLIFVQVPLSLFALSTMNLPKQADRWGDGYDNATDVGDGPFRAACYATRYTVERISRRGW